MPQSKISSSKKCSVKSKKGKQHANVDSSSKKTVELQFNEFQKSSDSETNLRVQPSEKSELNVKDSLPENIIDSKTSAIINNANCAIKNKYSHQSKNIMHYIDLTVKGQKCSIKLKEAATAPIIENAKKLVPVVSLMPFKRRVTAMTWHPLFPQIVAIASKGGELALYKNDEYETSSFIPGIGPGGSVVALKFSEKTYTHVYTASITGHVSIQDFEGRENEILLDTRSFENWFSSLDIHQNHLMAGDCRGYTVITDLDGKSVSGNMKMHKSKVTHIEFCWKQPEIVVTASTDHTAKIWDLRATSKSKCIPLKVFPHEKTVNSAFFSPSNGSSLLTTDADKEMKIYSAPLWHLKTVISHPHRHFQHITPIKAVWHPLADIIIVGRYPDPKFCETDKKTIDFYSESGEELYRLWTPDLPGIANLNEVNCIGNTMATGSGHKIIFWKDKNTIQDSMKNKNYSASTLNSRKRSITKSRSVTNRVKLANKSNSKTVKSKTIRSKQSKL